MRRAFVVAGAVLFGLVVMPFATGAGRARADSGADAGSAPVAAGPRGVLSANAQSFAMRIEYDIPLPAGSGNVANVNGEIQRSQAGESAKGLAASPSELGAVVGGTFADPQKTGHPVNGQPQTECFYPGNLVDTHFDFPTDTRGETSGAPPVSYSTARCAAGPEVELHAVSQSIGLPGTPTEVLGTAVSSGAVASDALARPDKDTLSATTQSRASGISVLGGVLKIGSVLASGDSSTTGKPGGGKSTASIAVSDINAGGVDFSLASASHEGKESFDITAAGQTVPIDSSAGKSVIDAANAAIGPNGCTITPLTSPPTYPQGFLFAQQPPEVGVKPDGTLAASYRGGLLVTCDMPKSVSDPTTFSPQRVQMLLGFAYTSTIATGEPLGFAFGDIAGGSSSPITASIGSGPLSSLPTTKPMTETLAPPASPVTNNEVAASPAQPPASTALPQAPTRLKPAGVWRSMDNADRWLLGLIGLIAWGLLTHAGARRFLLATVPCSDGPEEIAP